MNGVDTEVAKRIIQSIGYDINSLEFIHEGGSHYTFNILINNPINGDNEVIARFERSTRVSVLDGEKRDPHYNGLLSLKREGNLCTLVRNAGLPAPRIYGMHDTGENSFMLVEKLKGVHWSLFLKENQYSLKKFYNL